MLVNNKLARFSNCGKFLRALFTTSLLKSKEGTQLITGSNSNNNKDWIIRSQASKFVMIEYEEGSETRWESV